MEEQKIKISFLPKTILGKWSIWLIIAMFTLMILGMSLTDTLYESVSSGDTILQDIAKRPALALSMLAGMAVGITAFIVGLIAILKKKDRAILVFVATVIGALLILFLIGEVLYPH